MVKKNFGTLGNAGFHIVFPNGLTLSTQFSPGNYCEHHNRLLEGENIISNLAAPRKIDYWDSNDAEIAIWNNNDKWLTEKILKTVGIDTGGDSVCGYVRIESWLKIFDAVKNWKS